MRKRGMSYFDMGWRPTQAKYASTDRWLCWNDEAERIVSIHQHPLLTRVLVFTTDRGTHSYVKTAQVWLR